MCAWAQLIDCAMRAFQHREHHPVVCFSLIRWLSKCPLTERQTFSIHVPRSLSCLLLGEFSLGRHSFQNLEVLGTLGPMNMKIQILRSTATAAPPTDYKVLDPAWWVDPHSSSCWSQQSAPICSPVSSFPVTPILYIQNIAPHLCLNFHSCYVHHIK